MTVTELPMAQSVRPRSFPVGSGLALIGALLMVVGACGPWIGGKLFGGTQGLELGGDGWLVVASAGLAMLPLVLPLRPSGSKGVWVFGLAVGAEYVCWAHFVQANVDGFHVDWGLQLSALGATLLALAGLRLLLPRR